MQAHMAGARTGAGSGISSRTEVLAAAMAAALLGLVVLWTVGFSHIPALHNAAHDTRHSMAFPCH